MDRPYIICHMTVSLDGKVTGAFLKRPEAATAAEIYYEINRDYRTDGANAFACGRVTMEESFTGTWRPELSVFQGSGVSREDHVADKDAGFFAVAFDRRGRLGWKDSRIQDEDPGYGESHIIEVLCENTPEAYCSYLRSIGVSYVFAGQEEMDLPLALKKLKTLFGIEKLLLEGGSILNGAFQRQGVIDELSLVVSPVTAAAEDQPLFDGGCLEGYTLREIRQYEDSVLWMNYVK